MQTARKSIAVIWMLALLAGLFSLSGLGADAAPLRLPSNPGTTGLVSYWALDETSGTRYDSHGSNDLTDNNTVGYTTGVQGNAADFIVDK